MDAKAAYDEFLASLASAAELITGPNGAVDERERAEGFRHLSRLTSIALEMIVEKGDPAHPELTRWMNPHRKMMGDNPGTIYESAWLDPALHYVLRGNRGGTTWIGVCIYGTGEGGSRRIAGAIDSDVEYSADGSFELHLAASRPSDLPAGASFLALEADATDLLIRQYFHDPSAQAEATYSIEVVGGGAPPALSESVFADRLVAAGRYVRDVLEVETTISAISQTTAPPEIRKPGSTAGEGEVDWSVINRVQPTPAIGYAGAWFDDLDDDEVIVAQGVLPACDYASVQWLSRWMESGDYAHHQVQLTDRQMRLAADRSFSVSLSRSDPDDGTAWLDTTGIRHGTFVIRTLGAEPAEVTYRRYKREQ